MTGWATKGFGDKTIEDVFTFGKYVGVAVKDMTDGRQIDYLKWILREPDLEATWGNAVREHLKTIGVSPRKPGELKVVLPSKVIDYYSIHFFSMWFERYKISLDDPTSPTIGMATFIESQVRAMDRNVREGSVSFTGRYKEGEPCTLNFQGIQWTFLDTGAALVVRKISEVTEDEVEDIQDVPF